MRILFVCTGNLCRSPLAEGLASAWAARSLAHSPEATGLRLTSAGVAATEGRPMDPQAAAMLTQRGGDAAGFRSRLLTRDLAEDADLVLTMTRDQRRTVLELAPRGLRRTFTLTEAADLLARADIRGLGLMPLGERARQLGLRLDAARAGRQTAELDDIPDPIGQHASVHREVAETIETALRPLADVLFSSVRMRLPAPVAV